MAVIYIDDPKASPIYKQQRCGLGGELFTFYKFRTMVHNADELLNENFDNLDSVLVGLNDEELIVFTHEWQLNDKTIKANLE